MIIMRCPECSHPLTPLRASNRRHQRRHGKPILMDRWECRSSSHGKQPKPAFFSFRGPRPLETLSP